MILPKYWTIRGQICIRSVKAIWHWTNIAKIVPIFTKLAACYQRRFLVEFKIEPKMMIRDTRMMRWNSAVFFFLNSNGSEWWRLRSELQKGLSSPSHIRQFLCDSDSITKTFIETIPETAEIDAEHIADFLPELSRLNLECELILNVIKRFLVKQMNEKMRNALFLLLRSISPHVIFGFSCVFFLFLVTWGDHPKNNRPNFFFWNFWLFFGVDSP